MGFQVGICRVVASFSSGHVSSHGHLSCERTRQSTEDTCAVCASAAPGLLWALLPLLPVAEVIWRFFCLETRMLTQAFCSGTGSCNSSTARFDNWTPAASGLPGPLLQVVQEL